METENAIGYILWDHMQNEQKSLYLNTKYGSVWRLLQDPAN